MYFYSDSLLEMPVTVCLCQYLQNSNGSQVEVRFETTEAGRYLFRGHESNQQPLTQNAKMTVTSILATTKFLTAIEGTECVAPCYMHRELFF